MNNCFRRIFTGFFAIGMVATAQFKEIGTAPFPAAEAHQKIRVLLEQVDPSNGQQTVKTITGWLDWYRTETDEELIAIWNSGKRGNLNLVINDLGNSHVASEVMKAWRQPGLSRADSPVLENLMARYPDSARPFFSDLLEAPELSRSQAEAVCGVLIDMPDLRRESALRILPHYRREAQDILTEDLHNRDLETVGRAQFWLRDLRWDIPGETTARQAAAAPSRRRLDPPGDYGAPQAPSRSGPQAALQTPSQTPPSGQDSGPRTGYNGPRTGTLTCSSQVPQNAEYVFHNLPGMELKLVYDAKIWAVRLTPEEGGTQRLIVRNISSGPQKKCVVSWSLVQ